MITVFPFKHVFNTNLGRSKVSSTAGKLVMFIFSDFSTVEYGQDTQNKTPKRAHKSDKY